MNSIQTACYGLMASAFFLVGVLLVQLQGRVTATAEADMVLARQNFTVMTTRTKNDEEALFVLNNTTNRLLIYTAQVGRRTLTLVGSEDMGLLFGSGDGGRRRGR